MSARGADTSPIMAVRFPQHVRSDAVTDSGTPSPQLPDGLDAFGRATRVWFGEAFGTPTGVLLSTPLTMALIIALDASPSTRPLAVLLGPDIVDEPVALPGPSEPPQDAIPGV